MKRIICDRRTATINLSVCLFACTLLAGLPGCSEPSNGRMKTYPVKGKVLIDGQPADGAVLTFFGTEDRLKGTGVPVPMATTDAEGLFTVRSYGRDDGAPSGHFKVRVVWPEPMPEDADPDLYVAKDRLEGKYAKIDSTPLEVTIEEGSNELPHFELSSK